MSVRKSRRDDIKTLTGGDTTNVPNMDLRDMYCGD
jgi:hypothetical protein